MVNVEKLDMCPECGSTNIVHNQRANSVVCKDCGAEFTPLSPDDEEQFENASDVI